MNFFIPVVSSDLHTVVEVVELSITAGVKASREMSNACACATRSLRSVIDWASSAE